MQRNFPFFSSFFRYFQANLSKLLHFHFRKNIFGCFLNNFIRFFSMINNVFFQFEDFQLQIFQTFIFSILFWEKYFSAEFFFRIIFVKFQRQIFQIFEELIFKISSRIFWAIAHNGRFGAWRQWRKLTRKVSIKRHSKQKPIFIC